MVDTRTADLRARAEYEGLRTTCLQQKRGVSGVANGLRNPDRFFLVGAGMTAATIAGAAWSAWPSSDALCETVEAMKRACDAMNYHWEAMANFQREELPNPPARLGDPLSNQFARMRI